MIIVVLSLPVFLVHSSSISFSDSVSLISSRLVFGAVVGRPMFGLVVFFIYTVVIASSNVLLHSFSLSSSRFSTFLDASSIFWLLLRMSRTIFKIVLNW